MARAKPRQEDLKWDEEEGEEGEGGGGEAGGGAGGERGGGGGVEEREEGTCTYQECSILFRLHISHLFPPTSREHNCG